MNVTPMDIAKCQAGYCFEGGEARAQAIVNEFGYSPVIMGAFAAQMADAFEAGYAAGVFDTLVECRSTNGKAGEHEAG